MFCFHYLDIPRRKIDYSDAHILHGEGFRTVAATKPDTVMAMAELAIINCQIYGRNALSLKVCQIFLMILSYCVTVTVFFTFS